MHQRLLVSIFAISILCFFSSSRCHAQADPYLTDSNLRGVVPFGSYQFGDIDNINLGTGTLNLSISLFTRKGRGLDGGFKVSYSSKSWIQLPLYQNPQSPTVPTAFIWAQSGSGAIPYIVQTDSVRVGAQSSGKSFTCTNGGNHYIYNIQSDFSVTLADGSTYQFPNYGFLSPSNNPCGIVTSTLGYSSDGTMQLDTSLLQSTGQVIVKSKSGTQYFGLAQREDTNGNLDTVSTDTVGRQFQPSSQTVSYRDSSGTQQTYTLVTTFASTSTLTQFPSTTCSGGLQHLPVHQASEVQPSSKLTLPDGRSYVFSYDPIFDEITRVDLPSGGYIRYVYVTLPSFDLGSLSQTCLKLDSRRVAERHVSADGVHEDVWLYSYQKVNNATVTTVTDPAGNVAIHTFDLDGIHETQNEYRDNAGNRLKLVVNTWVSDNGPIQTAQDGTLTTGGKNLRISSTTTTLLDTNQVSKVETDYDSFTYTFANRSYTESRLNPVARREYDWGIGSPGSLLRRTVFTYLHDSNSNYLNAHIWDRVASSKVFDNLADQCRGVAQPCAQTLFFYDSTPITATTNVVQHDYTNFSSTFTVRGNLTETRKWRSTDGAWLSNKKWFDDLGNVVQTQSPLLYNTFFDYTDSWSTQTGGNTCAPASGTATTFLTKVTNHLGQMHHFSNYSCSSLRASVIDPNSNTLSLKYDLLDRAIEADLPDGGQTTKCFTDTPGSSCYSAQPPLKEITNYKINSSTNFMSTAVGDGLGRFIQSQLNSAPPVIYTDTVYDGLGRNKTVSNPYSSTSDSTYGITTFNYDGLGRLSKVIPPDGTSSTNNTTTVYTGNCTTTTDQAGKSRKSCSDGLGRLIQVLEDPAGQNLETDYTYDALGNLLAVNQKGGSTNSANWRTRTFTYDSLSQLVCASNPENSSAACPSTATGTYTPGTTGYTYDANGNLLTKTSPAPNQTGSATVVATYVYDALNRMTQKTFSDGSTGMYYWYDVHPTWGGTDVTNVVGRLVEAKNQFAGTAGSGTSTLYSYDTMGRIVRESQQTPLLAPGGEFLYTTYDLAGNVTSYTNGLGVTFTQTFDGAGRLSQLTSSMNDAQHPGTLLTADSSVGYFPNGALRKAALGNGLTLTNMYNNRLQPCLIDVNSSNTTLQTCTDATPTGNVLDFSYGYGTSNNGNVMQWNAVGAQTFNRSYTYDSFDRLGSLSDTASAQPCKGLSWTYDAWGNRTDQTVTAGTCTTFHASVDTNNRLSGAPYQYDAAGNMTHDASHSYTYDAENHLVAVDGSAATYVYDASGRRVEKKIGTSITDYLYDFSGNVVAEGTTGCGSLCGTNEYAYANGSLVAQYENSTTYFIHKDHLGSTRLLTKMDKSIVDNMDFLPFGEQITGVSSTSHKFTGKERDSESGLDNFGARYSSSSLGRFMSLDPKMFSRQRMFDPQQWNMYQYSRNDPVTMIDPDGREVTVAAELQKSYDHLMKSQSFRNAIAPYQGKDNPNLTIQRGTLGKDPMEPNRQELGKTKTSIALSIQNCSSATSCTTIPAKLKDASITIDNSVGEGKGKEQTEGVLAHEASHANDAVTDPQGYLDENAREANKLHDNRSEEKRADQFSDTVRKEVKQEEKQEKKQKKENPF